MCGASGAQPVEELPLSQTRKEAQVASSRWRFSSDKLEFETLAQASSTGCGWHLWQHESV